MRLTLLVIVASFAASARLNAQGTPPAPRGDRLQCGTDSMSVVLSLPDGQRRDKGRIVDQCTVREHDGVKELGRVYASLDAIVDNHVDTIVDEFATLRPLSYRSHSKAQTVVLDWSPSSVSGTITPIGQPARQISESVSGTVFDGASFDVVLRASPLSLGYATSVTSFVPGLGVRVLTAKVAVAETIAGTPAWRVEADYAGLPVTFWIAKDSRRLVKQRMTVGPGTFLEVNALPAARR